MAINRKQFLRYTGAAAAGASLGAVARGLAAPDVPDAGDGGILPDGADWTAPEHPEPTPARIVANESYAQGGEDLVVAFAIGYLGLGPHINYLDIGANHPVRLSNTYYFYLRGHRGVLVEPDAALCRLLRGRRKGDVILEAGIGPGAGEADFYVMSADGLSTFSKEEAEQQVAATGGRVAVRDVIRRRLLDINAVMDRHFQGAPTFLSIDTEGLDLSILRSVDFDRFRPPIICAETLIPGTRRSRPEIAEFLSGRGYAARGGSFVNTVFIDARRL